MLQNNANSQNTFLDVYIFYCTEEINGGTPICEGYKPCEAVLIIRMLKNPASPMGPPHSDMGGVGEGGYRDIREGDTEGPQNKTCPRKDKPSPHPSICFPVTNK